MFKEDAGIGVLFAYWTQRYSSHKIGILALGWAVSIVPIVLDCGIMMSGNSG
jgi:hypothetical protein